MARLIDANAIPWEEYYVPDPDSNVQWDFKKEFSVLKSVVDQMPTVDAVEVVRCKDCASGKGATHKVCPLYKQGLMKDDDYCSVGERKCND